MSTFHRRYIFVDFANLKGVKFRKLDKVCDKVFIFLSREEENIPADLVLHLQKMGKAVNWIPVDPKEEGTMNHVISFVMGRLHQKIDKMFEFAILSNEPEFDTMVAFINETGRSCLRVKQDKLEKAPQKKTVRRVVKRVTPEASAGISNFLNTEKKIEPTTGGHSKPDYITFKKEETEAIERGAENTINRLVRSGNRPSNVELLRDYIVTNNQGLIADNGGSVEQVITRLKDSQEIEINEDEVVYNF